MASSKISTAVIAVAGWGTRWLPITKSIEKCMLPVGTRPVVDWVVADCVQAGITRIIFIIAEEHTQIKQYYSHHAPLEEYLTSKGKAKYLDAVRQPQYAGVHFEFLVQPKESYGTAIPVAIAAAAMQEGESFVFLNGDDLIYRSDGSSEVADFCREWEESGAEAALMTKLLPKEEATKYGVVITNEQNEFLKIHEKPPLEALADVSHPSINLGKYIISPALLRMTLEYVAKPTINHDGEYYITDIFGLAADEGHHIKVHYITGEHLDAGTPKHWLATNQRVMGE